MENLIRSALEFLEQRKFTIKYVITGKHDGRWHIKAFDSNDKPLGRTIIVNSPGEAWKVWAVLNGYSSEEPSAQFEDTVAIEILDEAG